MTFPDGSKYEGTFYKNRINGFGKMIKSNGKIYEGD